VGLVALCDRDLHVGSPDSQHAGTGDSNAQVVTYAFLHVRLVLWFLAGLWSVAICVASACRFHFRLVSVAGCTDVVDSG